MLYYKTLSGQPVKTNNPSANMIPILERVNGITEQEFNNLCKVEYFKLCRERNLLEKNSF